MPCAAVYSTCPAACCPSSRQSTRPVRRLRCRRETNALTVTFGQLELGQVLVVLRKYSIGGELTQLRELRRAVA